MAMNNVAIIWTFAGVIASACFARGLKMGDTSPPIYGLLWYSFGALFLIGGAILWITMEDKVLIQHKIVLGVCGAFFGMWAALAIGEIIRPSSVDSRSASASSASAVLTPSQEQLLATIVKYQGRFVANKLVIGRNGNIIFDGQPEKSKEINIVTELYGTNDLPTQKKFAELMESIPLEYLRHYPEMRWNSPRDN
jgi:hypothetical protein